MNFEKTTHSIVLFAGRHAGEFAAAFRRTLSAGDSIGVFAVTNAIEREAWIGRVPVAFGSRNIALSFAVAAYERAANGATSPLGIACCVDADRSSVAIHTCERSEIHETSTNRPQEISPASPLLEFVQAVLTPGNSRHEHAIDSQIVDANDHLASVWHRRCPVVWSSPEDVWNDVPPNVPVGILSGAFHPLHEGHLALGKAAETFLGGAVHFELPIANAEKPRLDFLSIVERSRQFSGQTLAITSAATFAEKAAIFPGTTFVVGIDTAERIVDTRFYNDDANLMRSAFSEIRAAGCRFLVAGRIASAGFQTANHVQFSDDSGDLFIELPESHFRNDVSSTELRRNQVATDD